MRIIFMGTPGFAASILKPLAESRHEVVLAVSQPDRPKRRGHALAPTEVHALADSLGIPVFQPDKVRKPECVQVLREYHPDVIAVAAFGQLLPKRILSLPRYGCVNVHPSLLPKYRGPSPIPWAIRNRDKVTGVTIMQMSPGMDEGDILLQKEIAIDPEETADSLFLKAEAVGGPLLLEALDRIEAGTITPVPQDGSLSSYSHKIEKEDGKVDWNQPAEELEAFVRALTSAPGAWTKLDGKIVKLWKVRAVPAGSGRQMPEGTPCGTVVKVEKNSFDVLCAEGSLRVLELQLQGRKRMDSGAFLRGSRLTEGTVFEAFDEH
ncbi:MAG: methionyl-tRNA formyltransferase [Lachnospiraceae bacterium]|jgi:methionyl-tRNA formyltransferase